MADGLTIAILGCGSRGRTYARLLGESDQAYRLVAAADHNEVRLAEVERFAGNPDFRRFASADELFAAGRVADVLIVATQDSQHFEHAARALELDYDLLLEKPAAERMPQIVELRDLAVRRQRKVALCFVLRYTAFYRAAREVIASGRLGRVMHVELTEGVGAFHQVHSFVRGHWNRSADSTPMIVAKCCHDTDLLSWLQGGKRARQVSSFGSLSWFRPEHAPEGATARCTDGCPHAGRCRYDAHRYIAQKRRFLEFVYPGDTASASDDEVIDWLRQSPWGRCAWRCDNDVVDHQVVAVEMDDGSTATVTMSAFDEGRHLVVHGTEGTLRGGVDWERPGEWRLSFRTLDSPVAEDVPLGSRPTGGYDGHGGGDRGLVEALAELFADDVDPAALIDASLEGHLIAFGAEQSRLDAGRPVDLHR